MSELFEVDDYVVYGTKGVCKVEKIGPVDFGKKGANYYYLRHMNDKAGTIYAEVGSDKVRMRHVMTADEANEVISQMPDAEAIKVANEKARENTYKEAIESGDCSQLIGLLKGLYHRKQERLNAGKKVTDVDGRTYAKAERLLFEEFAIALNLDIDDVNEYVCKKNGVEESYA